MTSASRPTALSLFKEVTDILRAHPAQLALPMTLLGIIAGFGNFGPAVIAYRAYNTGNLFTPLAAGLEALFSVVAVLVFLAGVHVAATAARATFMPYRGEGEPDFRLASSAVARMYPRALLALLPAAAIIAVLCFVFIVPGLIALAVLIAVPAVVVAEGETGFNALTRSRDLTRGYGVELTVLTLVPLSVAVVPWFILGWIPFLGPVITGAGQGLAVAFVAVLSTVFYYRRLSAPDDAAPDLDRYRPGVATVPYTPPAAGSTSGVTPPAPTDRVPTSTGDEAQKAGKARWESEFEKTREET